MLESEKNTSQWQRYAFSVLVGGLILGSVFGAGFFAGRWSARGNPTSLSLFGQRIISPGGHGALGKISQIEETTLILHTRDGATQIILTDSQTRFERGLTKSAKLSLRDLKIGDQIIVIGTPNVQGQIKAKLIRVLNPSALTPTPAGL